MSNPPQLPPRFQTLKIEKSRDELSAQIRSLYYEVSNFKQKIQELEQRSVAQQVVIDDLGRQLAKVKIDEKEYDYKSRQFGMYFDNLIKMFPPKLAEVYTQDRILNLKAKVEAQEINMFSALIVKDFVMTQIEYGIPSEGTLPAPKKIPSLLKMFQ